MPRAIAELAAHMLRDPIKVAVAPAASTVERVEQRIIRVDRAAKPAALIEMLQQETIDRALIFTRTKHGADKVVRDLSRAGIAAEAIHGNKSQSQRERVLASFRKGEARTLVATDIAARGIDVDGVSHVVNFDLPNMPETYVHRIGRTARAGAEGIAISLCDSEEVAFLRDIENLIRMTIPVSNRGANRQGAKPATVSIARSPRQCQAAAISRGNGMARKQSHRGQPNEAPRGIASAAFMRGKKQPDRDGGLYARRWPAPS
jgi:superfamily II DNA/RNA helicase